MLNKKGDMLNKKINKIEEMTNKRIEKANIKKIKEEQKLLAKLSKPETRGRKALPEEEKKQKVKSNKPRGRPSKKQQTNIIVEQENIDIIFDDMYEYNDIVDINNISNDLINDLMSYNIIVNNDIQENIDIIFDDMHEYNDIVDINYISNDLINDLMSYNIAVNNDIQENVVNNEEIQENISNIINILIDNVLNIVKENMINNDEIQENISNIVDKSDDIYELLSTPVESNYTQEKREIEIQQCIIPNDMIDDGIYYNIDTKTRRADGLSKIKIKRDNIKGSYKHLSSLGRYKQIIDENNNKVNVLVDNKSLVSQYLTYKSNYVYYMNLQRKYYINDNNYTLNLYISNDNTLMKNSYNLNVLYNMFGYGDNTLQNVKELDIKFDLSHTLLLLCNLLKVDVRTLYLYRQNICLSNLFKVMMIQNEGLVRNYSNIIYDDENIENDIFDYVDIDMQQNYQLFRNITTNDKISQKIGINKQKCYDEINKIITEECEDDDEILQENR